LGGDTPFAASPIGKQKIAHLTLRNENSIKPETKPDRFLQLRAGTLNLPVLPKVLEVIKSSFLMAFT